MASILRAHLPWRRRPGAPSQHRTDLSVIAPDFSGRTVISFQHVWKRYPNGTEALRDINLSVPEGDFLFLVGPSGAGTSSPVRLRIFRRKVGLVFQDFKLLPQMTVHENVAFALRVLGESRTVIGRQVDRALTTVSLQHKALKYPRELSGGEQQRVAIARALVHAPSMIVADEPTGNLDPATAWEIMQLFLKINADGATVVMATHNREIVDLLRRRVVVIEDGQVVRDDRAGRYHEAPQASALRA